MKSQFPFLLVILAGGMLIAQNPQANLQVELTIIGSPGTFRIGQPIMLKLSLSGPSNRYMVNMTVTQTPRPVDEIIITPSDGVTKIYDESYLPDYAGFTHLTGQPVEIILPLSDWFRFDQPGHYIVQVRTSRVLIGTDYTTLKEVAAMTTQPVSFDIAAMSQEEEVAEVVRLSAIIDRAPASRESAVALKTLSYLIGDAAAREKVRRFVHPHPANPCGEVNPQSLLICRNQHLVFQLLEQEFRNPSTAVRPQLIWMLARLREPKNQEEETSIKGKYVQELYESLSFRPVPARVVSAQTLLIHFWRPPDPPTEMQSKMIQAAYSILRENFDAIALFDLQYVMENFWKGIKDPSLVPLLKKFLDNPKVSGIFYGARTKLISGLLDLAPAEARPYVLAEIKCAGSVVDFNTLARLPDRQLPELDGPLLSMIQNMAPLKNREFVMPKQKARLVARYASPAIQDDLLRIFDEWGSGWEPDTRAHLLAYFARWKGDDAMPLIEREIRLSTRSSKTDWFFLSSMAQAHYSETLDRLLKKLLDSDDLAAANTAAFVLSEYGAAGVKAILQARLERLKRELAALSGETNLKEAQPLKQSLEYGLKRMAERFR